MASSNAVRFLKEGADDRALALEMAWGRTLSQFYDSTKFYDMSGTIITAKNVGAGKSWQFETLADGPDPEFHTPGEEMLGQNYAFDDGNITIDDPIVTHKDVPGDQTRMAHFPIIQPLTIQNGRKIAENIDTKMAIMACLAARTAAADVTVGADTLSVHTGGNVVTANSSGDVTTAYPASSIGAAAFRDDARQLAQLFDEANIPEAMRFLYISPYIRRVLSYDLTIFNRDVNPTTMNVLNKRIIGELEGFNLIVSNRIPSTNINTYTGVHSKYNGDFSYNGSTGRPAALALCGAVENQSAIGMVTAGGLETDMMWDQRRRTTFLYAGLVVGLGVLFPPAAGEIRVAA